jgi:hypothetical protein
MCYEIKQGSTDQPLLFLLVDSTDHVTPETGKSPTVTISKNGGSFASPAGAVSEIANGWYKVAGNATDNGTLGPLILHAEATGCDPQDVIYHVVATDPLVAVATAAALATVDGIVDSILEDTGTTIPGSLTTVQSTIDDIATVTDSITSNGSGLSAIPWNAAWDAEVESEVTDALNAYDPPTNIELNTAISGLDTEIKKIPRHTSQLAAGQFRVTIEGGESANITLGAPT